MSRLRLPSGDDHPDAAAKHLADAQVLLSAARADGAAYLAGYVVECALKTLWLYERGVPSPSQKPGWKAGRSGHDISELRSDVAMLATVAGAKIARYVRSAIFALPTARIASWNPAMRYRPPSMTVADAKAWVEEARLVYSETIGEMIKDGVL